MEEVHAANEFNYDIPSPEPYRITESHFNSMVMTGLDFLLSE
jgi:hypothetical protein